MKNTASATFNRQSLVPHAGIPSVMRQERRYLHAFFGKLVEADINFISDLTNYTEGELFTIAPTSKSNRARFMRWVSEGKIKLKTSSPS